MTESSVIKVQKIMDDTYGNIHNVLHYIETVEKSRSLTETEKTLKNYCKQMQSLTSYTMQMLDEETWGKHV